jgi:hypothetical protein
MVFVATMAILSYMGTPRFLVSSSPDQEIVAELLPQTHPGPLRESDWSDIPAGEYTAADWANAPTPTLKNLLHLYQEEVEIAENSDRCRRANNCLTEPEGQMIVQDWQTDVKRITFRVIWEGGPETFCQLGQHEFCQVVYYHKNANYWQKP